MGPCPRPPKLPLDKHVCKFSFAEYKDDADVKDVRSKASRRYIDDLILQEMDDRMNVNKYYVYSTKPNHFFLVRHSQSSIVPDCPPGSTTLWRGYSLYSVSFDNNIITRDLGTVDSCVQLFSQAYFSYCNGNSDCNAVSTVLWLSDRNTSIGRCSVCHVFSLPITLHGQSTTPTSCPPHWSSLWEGYSHIQVSEFIRIQCEPYCGS